MCGVCGTILWKPGDSHLGKVLAMRDLLEHRGPDGKGVIEQDRGVLAATRLAIRGGAEGHQPLRDPETGVLIVCNGEIDNHHALREWLRSLGRGATNGSDVTILTDLYLEKGEELPSVLEGPFALAVWDPRRNTLLLARDRVGERPLFYVERDDEVTFATELSALAKDLGDDLALDREALAYYLRFGRFRAPTSPFRAVRKVAPSEVVIFQGREKLRRTYWRWPIGTKPKERPSIEGFDAIFREAVRRQTDCDVDYGLFLSGGVDSSLVAAVERSLRPGKSTRAYTVRFDEASFDESSAAAEVAEHLGLEHIVVPVAAIDFPVKIRELVRLVGEPLGDPAWVPTAMLARRAARDVKVVLVGEGGDELFGGYPTYLGALLSGGYGKLPASLRRLFAALVRRWPPSDRKVALSFLLKRFVEGDRMEPLARHLLWTSMVPPALLERLGARPVEAHETTPDIEPLDEIQRYDLENYLAEGLLTKADRASMGWALEPRAPFLDRGVLEFAATLPRDERVRRLQTKTFLKRYAQRYLPSHVVHRRKKGLSVPLSSWLRGPLHDWARERLASGLLSITGIETSPAIQLLEDHCRRRQDNARALWCLLVLAEWIEWYHELEHGLTEVGLERTETVERKS